MLQDNTLTVTQRPTLLELNTKIINIYINTMLSRIIVFQFNCGNVYISKS